MNSNSIPDFHSDSDRDQNSSPTTDESNEGLLDEQLRVAGVVNAQVDLLRHVCRLVAEAWRESHCESQTAQELKAETKDSSSN